MSADFSSLSYAKLVRHVKKCFLCGKDININTLRAIISGKENGKFFNKDAHNECVNRLCNIKDGIFDSNNDAEEMFRANSVKVSKEEVMELFKDLLFLRRIKNAKIKNEKIIFYSYNNEEVARFDLSILFGRWCTFPDNVDIYCDWNKEG